MPQDYHTHKSRLVQRSRASYLGSRENQHREPQHVSRGAHRSRHTPESLLFTGSVAEGAQTPLHLRFGGRINRVRLNSVDTGPSGGDMEALVYWEAYTILDGAAVLTILDGTIGPGPWQVPNIANIPPDSELTVEITAQEAAAGSFVLELEMILPLQ